jgi:hypothetical protein
MPQFADLLRRHRISAALCLIAAGASLLRGKQLSDDGDMVAAGIGGTAVTGSVTRVTRERMLPRHAPEEAVEQQ